MKTVIQNRFDGGLANNPRDTGRYIQNTSGNFDVFAESNSIAPYRDVTDDTVGGALVLADIRISEIVTYLISGSLTMVGLGRESAGSANARILTKSLVDSSWSPAALDTRVPVLNSLVAYKDKAYYITTVGDLMRFDAPSTLTYIGTLSSTYSGYWAKPFVHPDDKLLYWGAQNKIFRYDGTSFSAAAVLTLPDNAVITSLTNYGGYLAIACRFVGGSQTSCVFLWGRNSALTTLQDIIDFGEGDLMVLENIGGALVGVKGTANSVGGNINRKVTVLAYQGGYPQVIEEIDSNTEVYPFKATKNNTLYFTHAGATALYRVGRNLSGDFIVSPDKFLNNGASVATCYGFSIINDYAFVTIASGALRKTTSTDTFTSQSFYQTTINYGMELNDRTKEKRLIAVSLGFSPLASGQTVELQYRVNGGSWVSIFTESTVGKVFIEAANESTGTPFLDGEEYEFKAISTGGAEITFIKYGYETQASLF